MNDNTPSPTETPTPKKEDVVLAIAKALADRRKLRNLSIEKVSEATKIRPHLLMALEQGRWEDLPGEVYVRGFVTRYAQFLGLQPLDLLNPYLELTHQHDVVRRASDNDQRPSDPAKLPWIIGGVVLIVIIGVVRFVSFHVSDQRLPANVEKKPVMAVAESTGALHGVVDAVPAIQPSAPGIGRKHTLLVFSPQELWIRATSQTRTFEGTIPSGSTWTFSAEGKINLRLGHTRDVTLLYDNQPIAVIQKRTFDFDEN